MWKFYSFCNFTTRRLILLYTNIFLLNILRFFVSFSLCCLNADEQPAAMQRGNPASSFHHPLLAGWIALSVCVIHRYLVPPAALLAWSAERLAPPSSSSCPSNTFGNIQKRFYRPFFVHTFCVCFCCSCRPRKEQKKNHWENSITFKVVDNTIAKEIFDTVNIPNVIFTLMWHPPKFITAQFFCKMLCLVLFDLHVTLKRYTVTTLV